MVKMIELGRRFEMQVKMMKQVGDTEESLASIMRIG
jgi:flagellar basal body rod protein FlgF